MRWLTKNKEIPVLSPRDGYDLWASTYLQESNPIKNLSDQLIEKHLPDLTGKIFLDAGCGAGKFCRLAHNQKAKSIIGLDLSPAMIEAAQKYCPAANLKCADLSTAELQTDHFDVIICALVLAHIEDLKRPLHNLLNALKKGGVLIITDFHPFLTLMNSKRTFKDNRSGREYEVQHHLHLFQEYFEAFHKYGLIVDYFEEPVFHASPVVFGIRAQKVLA